MVIFTSGGETSKTSLVPWEHFHFGRTSCLYWRWLSFPSFTLLRFQGDTFVFAFHWGLAWLLVGCLTGWLGWSRLGLAVLGLAGLGGNLLASWLCGWHGRLQWAGCEILDCCLGLPRVCIGQPAICDFILTLKDLQSPDAQAQSPPPPRNPEGVLIPRAMLWSKLVTIIREHKTLRVFGSMWVALSCCRDAQHCVIWLQKRKAITLLKLHSAYWWSEFEEKCHWWVRTVITPNKKIIENEHRHRPRKMAMGRVFARQSFQMRSRFPWTFDRHFFCFCYS